MLFARENLPLPRAIEPGVEIVAIGDIHGRADLLDALLGAAAATPLGEPVRRLVFTGDLVDRGPDSLGALELARDGGDLIGAQETVGLMGNHEILMRLALDPANPPKIGLAALRVWIGNGGEAVVEQLLGARAFKGEPRRMLEALRAATPAWALAWLDSLRPYYICGNVLFVHAGINPRMPLEDFLSTPWDEPLDRIDEAAHWAWVRGPFLDHRPGPQGFSGYLVVHGHTPLDRGSTHSHSEQVERFRLNLDGGSAMTGIAKMAILRGGVAEVVTASAR
jgi:serine/threonine protein phosphatase 1